MILLSLGSNLGDRINFLKSGLQKIDEAAGKVIMQSSVYETQPWGFNHSNFFLNQVIGVQSGLSPTDLLRALLKIENELGRNRDEPRYSARTIDLDLLLYNDLVENTSQLILPHPRLHLRKFILVPLCELVPTLVHPVFKKTIEELLTSCNDSHEVTLFCRTG